MYQIDGRLKGAGTLLFNRYTEKSRPGKLRQEELLEEATRRVYRNDRQSLIWPAWNLLRTFMDGARLGEVKHGRKSIVPYLAALIIVEPDPDFGRVDYDGLHICMGRVPPRTGAMVTLYRPKLDPGWMLTFRLLIADTTLHPETIRQIINFSGLLAGMGAWRPAYGRFVLDAFEVSGHDSKLQPETKKKRAIA
jgi:hypothetical protein